MDFFPRRAARLGAGAVSDGFWDCTRTSCKGTGSGSCTSLVHRRMGKTVGPRRGGCQGITVGGVAADVVVVGGGIAGASVAYELAAARSVLLVEAEPELARHSTARSAATYLP